MRLAKKQLQLATFAGGCFWCMEAPFQRLVGVESVTSGYSGGDLVNPDYEQVCSGTTGHLEAVQISFDPQKVSYRFLLKTFWRQIDPTDDGGAFADRGPQYRTAVFYHDESQRQEAEASKQQLEESGRFSGPLVTEIVAFKSFYPAEAHHQNYHARNPIRYYYYRSHSGRDQFLDKVWSADASGKKS